MEQKLSHISRSPTSQVCSYLKRGSSVMSNRSLRMASLSARSIPSMRMDIMRFTYSARRPVTGWLMKMGCM